jgi:hypothetical protein
VSASAGTVNADGREFLDVLFTDPELEALVHTRNSGDRDGYPLLSPKVALVEQDVSYRAIPTVDDQTLHTPDRAIRSVNMLASTYVDLTDRRDIRSDSVLSAVDAHTIHVHASRTQLEVRQREHLRLLVVPRPAGTRHEVRLLSFVQREETRRGAPQPNLVLSPPCHELDRHQTTRAATVLRLDDEVGDRSRYRINNDARQLSQVAVIACHFGTDDELGRLVFSRLRHRHTFTIRSAQRRRSNSAIAAVGNPGTVTGVASALAGQSDEDMLRQLLTQWSERGPMEITALTPTKFWSRNYGPPEIEANEN